MQDRNAKAPKVRSGDEINPVLGTIIKISVLVVIAALVVLTTLIIVEFVKRNKTEENVFKDKIHITEEDFKIITEQQDHYDLSEEIRDIMENVNEDDDIYFFFYYSDITKDYDKEITDLINSRDNDNPLFLVDLNVKQTEDEDGNVITTIVDYLKTVEDLSPSSNNLEFNTIIQRKNTYEYFLVIFNEAELNNNDNPFTIKTNFSAIETDILSLLEKEEEED